MKTSFSLSFLCIYMTLKEDIIDFARLTASFLILRRKEKILWQISANFDKPIPCCWVCYLASVVLLAHLADNFNEGLIHCFCLLVSLWVIW